MVLHFSSQIKITQNHSIDTSDHKMAASFSSLRLPTPLRLLPSACPWAPSNPWSSSSLSSTSCGITQSSASGVGWRQTGQRSTALLATRRQRAMHTWWKTCPQSNTEIWLLPATMKSWHTAQMGLSASSLVPLVTGTIAIQIGATIGIQIGTTIAIQIDTIAIQIGSTIAVQIGASNHGLRLRPNRRSSAGRDRWRSLGHSGRAASGAAGGRCLRKMGLGGGTAGSGPFPNWSGAGAGTPGAAGAAVAPTAAASAVALWARNIWGTSWLPAGGRKRVTAMGKFALEIVMNSSCHPCSCAMASTASSVGVRGSLANISECFFPSGTDNTLLCPHQANVQLFVAVDTWFKHKEALIHLSYQWPNDNCKQTISTYEPPMMTLPYMT